MAETTDESRLTGTFTAHNIRLPDGTFTMPESNWTTAESPWMTSAQRVVEIVFGDRLAGRRVLDLGCLEGGYTLEFARMGMDAVGIEVRESNYANCELVREAFDLPNLSFVRDDVWNVSSQGPADVIFCCGLLYHLDRPRAFIELMASLAPKVIIMNTHYAPVEPSPTFTLSDIVEHEGLPGRWYQEHAETDPSVLETFKWTSWSNQQSFWLTKPAILTALHDAGFDAVFEQYDWLGDDLTASMTDGYYVTHSRAQFVAIRSGD
jgi:SAM-dependent methyltransferase